MFSVSETTAPLGCVLQLSEVANKAHTRRLEVKLDDLKGLEALRDKATRYRAQARELQRRLMGVEAELAAAEEVGEDREKEISTLR